MTDVNTMDANEPTWTDVEEFIDTLDVDKYIDSMDAMELAHFSANDVETDLMDAVQPKVPVNAPVSPPPLNRQQTRNVAGPSYDISNETSLRMRDPSYLSSGPAYVINDEASFLRMKGYLDNIKNKYLEETNTNEESLTDKQWDVIYKRLRFAHHPSSKDHTEVRALYNKRFKPDRWPTQKEIEDLKQLISQPGMRTVRENRIGWKKVLQEWKKRHPNTTWTQGHLILFYLSNFDPSQAKSLGSSPPYRGSRTYRRVNRGMTSVRNACIKRSKKKGRRTNRHKSYSKTYQMSGGARKSLRRWRSVRIRK